MAYTPAYQNENTGENKVLEIGSVTGIGYKRAGVKGDKVRYRLIEKIYVDGKKFQLNGTLTEVTTKPKK